MKIRKIISKTEEEKKRKINQLLIGGVLILVMVFSVLGYSLGRNDESKSEKISYNGFEFVKQNGFWTLNKDSLQFYFSYNPNEVEKINAILNPLSNYLGKPLYIHSESSVAGTEIYKNLFYYNQIAQRMQDACPPGETCDGNLPVKTCSDNFIILKKSNITSIKQEDNCVFIDGKEEDLLKLVDSFLFKIIGIQ
jgi:hypothetical protein